MKNNRKNRKKMILWFNKLVGKRMKRLRYTHKMAAAMIHNNNMWKKGKYAGGRTSPLQIIQGVGRYPRPDLNSPPFVIRMIKNRYHGTINQDVSRAEHAVSDRS